MKTRLFIALLIALFLWNCTNEEPVMSTAQSPETSEMSSGRYLSAKEACEIARHSLVTMDFAPASRTEKAASAYLYNPYKSRANENDTLFYVVNFEEGGFALILADREATNNTIAISATGCYEDNINPASEAYILAAVNKPTLPIDPPFPFEPVNPNPWAEDGDGYQVGVYEDTYNFEHFINVAWKQSYPYNTRCSLLSEKDMSSNEYDEGLYRGHGVVGCGPLAVGQICTYYKKPQQFAGHVLHWEAMTVAPKISGLNELGKGDVSFLLANIGFSVGLKHGLKTELEFSKLKDCFNKLGYTDVKITTKISDCFDALIDGEIVLMGGKSNQGGHAWVVDGFKRIIKTWRRFEKGSSTVSHEIRREEINYLTFNWGWGSIDHVYYLANGVYETGDFVFDDNFKYIVSIH